MPEMVFTTASLKSYKYLSRVYLRHLQLRGFVRKYLEIRCEHLRSVSVNEAMRDREKLLQLPLITDLNLLT